MFNPNVADAGVVATANRITKEVKESKNKPTNKGGKGKKPAKKEKPKLGSLAAVAIDGYGFRINSSTHKAASKLPTSKKEAISTAELCAASGVHIMRCRATVYHLLKRGLVIDAGDGKYYGKPKWKDSKLPEDVKKLREKAQKSTEGKKVTKKEKKASPAADTAADKPADTTPAVA